MPEDIWKEILGPHGAFALSMIANLWLAKIWLKEKNEHNATRQRLDTAYAEQDKWLKAQIAHQTEVKDFIIKQSRADGGGV